MADEDRLQALLTGRMAPPSGGPNAKIGAQPEPSKGRKLLETLTGYPADPMREMEPMDGIQMLLGGLGAAKGLGAWGKTLMGTKSAKMGEIADDLYGLNPKQTRRQFIDRAMGKPQQRVLRDGEQGFKKEWNNIESEYGPFFTDANTGEEKLMHFPYDADGPFTNAPALWVRDSIEAQAPKWLKPFDALRRRDMEEFFMNNFRQEGPSSIMNFIRKRFGK